MPGIGRTNDLPRRGLLGQLGFLRGREGVGYPVRVPGGQAGVAPIPSRLAFPLGMAKLGGPALVPGGQWGTVRLYAGDSGIPHTAPFMEGGNEGFSVRISEGRPIEWVRRYFDNLAGQNLFQAYGQSTPDWTSNAEQSAPVRPLVPIPFNRKRVNWGGYRRTYAVDEQLFDQLTDRAHPWPIQKPMQLRVRTSTRQPIQRTPYFPKLTSYTPAASYGQTTRSIVSPKLTNLLLGNLAPAATQNPQVSGGAYGSY
jgi:hypothetical protein